MKNFEVFIIVAAIAGFGYYWYKNRAASTVTTPKAVTGGSFRASATPCNQFMWPCQSNACGMISRIVTNCGQVL